jgi:hypothetical protein
MSQHPCIDIRTRRTGAVTTPVKTFMAVAGACVPNLAPTRHELLQRPDIATTQRYTHLRPVHEIPAHERLADAVPIADLVTAPRKRASSKGVGKNDGTRPEPREELKGKSLARATIRVDTQQTSSRLIKWK